MSFKIHCLNQIAGVGLDRLSGEYEMTDDINAADGILVRSASMHETKPSDRLLCVARAGAGVNNIPLDDMAKKGIVVFNTPGANANGVKELVIAGMLLAARDVVGGIEWVKENASDPDIAKNVEKAKKGFAGRELFGKKLGVIGLGAIGVRVANTALELGMDVYGYDPYLSVDAAWNLSRQVKHVLNPDDIYAECDYVTIHVPLLDSTKGMIDAAAISKMKKGVVVLNFARDLLVNENDMLKALESSHVFRYVTDFPNTTTAGAAGCIVTPHLGASTEESEDNCAVMAVNEMMNYLENGNIRNSVNYPDCDLGQPVHAGRVAIFHENKANMITAFTTAIGKNGVNIAAMTNKSKKDVAYTLFDIDSTPGDDMIQSLESISGVYRVRVVKK